MLFHSILISDVDSNGIHNPGENVPVLVDRLPAIRIGHI